MIAHFSSLSRLEHRLEFRSLSGIGNFDEHLKRTLRQQLARDGDAESLEDPWTQYDQ